MSPGSSNYVSGDLAPLTTIEWYNKNNEKELDTEASVGNHLASDIGPYKKHSKITKLVADTLIKKGVKRLPVFLDRVKHEPFLVPLGIGGKAGIGEDWVSRLAGSRISKVFQEGMAMGYKTDTDDETGSPIPKFVMGE
jgi:hypothetical protein